MASTYKVCQQVKFSGERTELIPDTKKAEVLEATVTEKVCAEGEGIDGARAELQKVIAGRCSELQGNFRCKKAKAEGTAEAKKVRSFWEALFESMSKYNMKRDPNFF